MNPAHTASHSANMGCLPSPPPSDTRSTRSSPIAKSRQIIPEISISVGSVQFSNSEVDITSGQSSPDQNSPTKSLLKNRELKAANSPSLFDPYTPIKAASTAMDDVLIGLKTCDKGFKRPSELDFPINGKNKLVLLNTEKNGPFINQLRKLDGLRARLAEIPTYGNEQLEDKHNVIGAAIGRALQRMKEHQFKLYAIFVAGAALDNTLMALVACAKDFKCPSELDFSESAKPSLILRNTRKNKPFINQLQKLDGLRAKLDEIPTHSNEQLEDKHKSIRVAIGRALQRMKEHQLRLYYNKFPDEAKLALYSIRLALDDCVKHFEYPSELDFSSTRSSLVLPDTEKNGPFIDQLRKLDVLRSRLAEIPTHEKAEWQRNHRATGIAIEHAYQGMKGHQLRLHQKFVEAEMAAKAAEAPLNNIIKALIDCVENFEYPSELDFPTNTRSSLVLLDTEKNKPFINRLRRLDGFRTRLAEIPTHDHLRWKEKHRIAGIAIGRALQRMKEHQLKLYEKARRSDRA